MEKGYISDKGEDKPCKAIKIDFTAGKGAIPRTDFDRMDNHAKAYYEAIRKRSSDVTAISKNTGFSIEDINSIKQHIFFEKHDLGDEIPERFTPDYDMAVSWQRLIEGTDIKEMDVVLLNHELAELKLMNEGYSYKEAHSITDKTHNYAKYTKKLNEEAGIL